VLHEKGLADESYSMSNRLQLMNSMGTLGCLRAYLVLVREVFKNFIVRSSENIETKLIVFVPESSN